MIHRNEYRKCTVKWWRWLLSIPKSINPASDIDGSCAHVMQNDPKFFFLCQTFESKNYIPQRSIQVPRGRRIFMPLINWLSVKDGNETDEELMSLACERMEKIGKLELYIDGKQILSDIQKYRVRSPFFQFELCADNILGAEARNTRMISDGYWIMLEPVFERFEINSFGACSSGATQICANYNITMS